MESLDTPVKQSPPRKLKIVNEAFGFGNIEAWVNIIRSYRELHPEHRVILIYHGRMVQSPTYLFKLGKELDRDAFQLTVEAPDKNFKHLTKLHRLLVEGAGPDYEKFLVREINKTLSLF